MALVWTTGIPGRAMQPAARGLVCGLGRCHGCPQALEDDPRRHAISLVALSTHVCRLPGLRVQDAGGTKLAHYRISFWTRARRRVAGRPAHVRTILATTAVKDLSCHRMLRGAHGDTGYVSQLLGSSSARQGCESALRHQAVAVAQAGPHLPVAGLADSGGCGRLPCRRFAC